MSDLKNEFLRRIKLRAGGNSKRGMKELASDLINNSGMNHNQFADLAMLSPSTVARLAELTPTKTGSEYRPQSDTIERVIRACGAEISLTPVDIKPRYQNQPKAD